MTLDKNPPGIEQTLSALVPHFLHSLGFALAAGLLVLAPTFYMFEVYGRVLDSRNPLTLAMLTLLVLSAYALMELLEWARSETMREAAELLERRLAPQLFDALHEQRRLGAAATLQPMHDLRTLRDFLCHPVLAAAMELPLALALALILFALSPLLGWTALAGALLQAALAGFNERSTQPQLTAAARAAIAAQQYADGSLRNAEVIEAMGMLRAIHRRWIASQNEFIALQAQASERAGWFQAASRFLQTTVSSALLGLGAWLLLQHQLDGGSGMLIVASMLGARLLAPQVQIVSRWRAVVAAREAAGRLGRLLAQLPSRPAAMSLPAPVGALSVEHLVAGAPGSQLPILKDLNFTLRPGEVLAVVGPSASGKTTLARLLVGLWPAISGKVRLDGSDIHAWDKRELGPHLGYLPQGVELLEGTIAENIARFGEVEPQRVEAAARAVGLHELIAALPQGYGSPVGADGALLSGGMRQRVALARAIYGDPVLVVLDEPNSSLDEAGDAALLQAMVDLKARGTSFVVITHRSGVLAAADMMLVLRDGVQQAFGPCDKVLAAIRRVASAV